MFSKARQRYKQLKKKEILIERIRRLHIPREIICVLPESIYQEIQRSGSYCISIHMAYRYGQNYESSVHNIKGIIKTSKVHTIYQSSTKYIKSSGKSNIKMRTQNINHRNTIIKYERKRK